MYLRFFFPQPCSDVLPGGVDPDGEVIGARPARRGRRAAAGVVVPGRRSSWPEGEEGENGEPLILLARQHID